MTIKRALLFTFGLIYGAVVNSVLLGVGYGLYAVGVAMVGLLRVCGQSRGCVMSGTGADSIIGAMIGCVLLIAIVGGFAVGVVYGLVMGAWHCAMDFHNNGFMQGLSSPFRYFCTICAASSSE